MQVTYRLQSQDIWECIKLHRTRTVLSKIMWIFLKISFIFAGIAAVLSLVVLGLPTRKDATFWFLLIGGTYFFFWSPYRYAQKYVAQTPSAKIDMTLNASESGLHFVSSLEESAIAWNSLSNWMESKSVFMLELSPFNFYAIPKRSFTEEQISEFRNLLRKQIVTR